MLLFFIPVQISFFVVLDCFIWTLNLGYIMVPQCKLQIKTTREENGEKPAGKGSNRWEAEDD